jgi:thymidylate synthase ThyX
VARYVIPIAAFTSMVHTVSGIVLHRLYRMMRTGDAPRESARVVEAMVARVREVDPDFFTAVGAGPLAEEDVVEARFPRVEADADAAADAADALLGARTSLLVDYSARAEELTRAPWCGWCWGPRLTLPDEAAPSALPPPSPNCHRLGS